MEKQFSQKEHMRVVEMSGEYLKLKAQLLATNGIFEAARTGEIGRSLAMLADELKEIVTGPPVVDRQG
jgi:hypothetical protein